MINTIIYEKGDLVRVSHPGVYHRSNVPRIGIVVDQWSETYDGATVLKVGFGSGGMQSIILDGDNRIIVELLSRRRD